MSGPFASSAGDITVQTQQIASNFAILLTAFILNSFHHSANLISYTLIFAHDSRSSCRDIPLKERRKAWPIVIPCHILPCWIRLTCDGTDSTGPVVSPRTLGLIRFALTITGHLLVERRIPGTVYLFRWSIEYAVPRCNPTLPISGPRVLLRLPEPLVPDSRPHCSAPPRRM